MSVSLGRGKTELTLLLGLFQLLLSQEKKKANIMLLKQGLSIALQETSYSSTENLPEGQESHLLQQL